MADLYCCDEDIAVRDPANFLELVPDDQVIALGTDGAISAGSPWVLSSASASFVAAGVATGHVVSIDGPTAPFGPSGDLLAVDSCTATTLTLRRKGMALGIGQPPPAATSVAYAIRTFGPQIDNASYDLNRRFGIDDNFALAAAANLYDPRELRQLAVLAVLVGQYTSDVRTKDGDWAVKRDMARADYEELLDRVALKWGKLGQGQPAATRFGARISR